MDRGVPVLTTPISPIPILSTPISPTLKFYTMYYMFLCHILFGDNKRKQLKCPLIIHVCKYNGEVT